MGWGCSTALELLRCMCQVLPSIASAANKQTNKEPTGSYRKLVILESSSQNSSYEKQTFSIVIKVLLH
jgi:hypothetical protein